jgi:hypothetical protein
MANPPSTRIRFLAAVLWRMKAVFLLAVLSGPAFAQSVSLARLNDGALNCAAANPFDCRNVASDVSSAGATPANSALAASPVAAASLPEAPEQHKFWDNENRVLFTTVAVLSAADFAITRSILQNGGKELNPVTRLFSGSTAGLAVNFTGETVGIIGLSYLFHRTGHHKLERITPMLDIGTSTFAVVYDLNHR